MIKTRKFGTFEGVFLPSVLTILGIVMFLRMGWIVSKVGLAMALVIITLSTSVTLITTLSISANATNMKIGSGGAYYMISRSLGVEAGASVGIPLYFAQTIGIAFYLSGFTESLSAMNLLGSYSPTHVSLIALLALTILALTSANLAIKIQFLIFISLTLALISFFAGGELKSPIHLAPAAEASFTFWHVFAVFFPAVTGIEAGLSMSGDLKEPSSSLPLGTLLAVVISYFIYLCISIFLAVKTPSPEALLDSMLMQKIARYPYLVTVGIWGASLSSALAGVLGGSRTLQALVNDGVFTSLKKNGGFKSINIVFATLISSILASVAILLGDLNAIAPILTMFFLTSYGALNFIAGIQGFISPPSWRPEFKMHWSLPLFGSFMCLSIMFLIEPGATLISLIIVIILFRHLRQQNRITLWGDFRRAILLFFTRYSIERLSRLTPNVMSWSPNILVFSGSPLKRWYLIELGRDLISSSGFLSLSTIIPAGSIAEDKLESKKKAIEDYIERFKIPALVHVSVAEDVAHGVANLVRDYGLGPIVPNTIIMGDTTEDNKIDGFCTMIHKIYQYRRNIIIVRMPRDETKDQPELKFEDFLNSQNREFVQKRIDIWWGREKNNASLSLALGYILQQSKRWDGVILCLKTIVSSEQEMESAKASLLQLVVESRLRAECHVYFEDDNLHTFARIAHESRNSDLVLLGMRPPDLDRFHNDRAAAILEYGSYYEDLLSKTNGFPPLAMIIAAENLDFHKIFSGS